MIKMKLPSGKELSVSTSPGDTIEKKEAKASSEKSDVIINITGGNNTIAPNATKVEQNIQTFESKSPLARMAVPI